LRTGSDRRTENDPELFSHADEIKLNSFETNKRTSIDVKNVFKMFY